MLRVTLLLLVVPSIGASAADPVLTGQVRSVHATSQTIAYLWDENSNAVFPDFDPPTNTVPSSETVDDVSAPDFQAFTATASTLDPGFVIFPLGTASSSQTSSLSPGLLTASGSYDMASDAYFMSQAELDLANFWLQPPVPYNFGIAGDNETGRSSFSVDFDVSEPTSFHLSGALTLSAGDFFIFVPSTSGTASISLSESGGASVATLAIDQAVCALPPCTPLADSIDATGVLAPGSYTLSAEVQGSASSNCADVNGLTCFEPTSDGSFDLVLELGAATPVPAMPPVGLPLLAAALGLAARRALRPRSSG